MTDRGARNGPPLVVFLPVSYCDSHNIERLAASIGSQKCSERIHIEVVDNCPQHVAGQLDIICRTHASTVSAAVVRPQRNLNYWRGAHFGFETVQQRFGCVPLWTVVMNSDMELMGSSFVERLLSIDGDECSVVAPRIWRYFDGREQNPFLLVPLSKLRKIYWKVWYSGYWIARIIMLLRDLLNSPSRRARKRGSPRHQRRMKIYAPHGACVCFHRSFFERGGYFDRGFEMYGEELTVGEIARRRGLSVMYEPTLQVIHYQKQRALGALDRDRYEMAREAYTRFIREYRPSSQGTGDRS